MQKVAADTDQDVSIEGLVWLRVHVLMKAWGVGIVHDGTGHLAVRSDKLCNQCHGF